MTPRDHQSQEAVYLKIIKDVIDDELDDEYVITKSDTALRVVINTEDNMYFHEKRNHLHSSRRIDCVLQTFV